MADDPTYDIAGGSLAPMGTNGQSPAPELAEVPPDQAVIRRLPTWPDSPGLRGHDEVHPVPGAVPANQGRTCPACKALLWSRHRVPPAHTIEACQFNRAWLERLDGEPGQPDGPLSRPLGEW